MIPVKWILVPILVFSGAAFATAEAVPAADMEASAIPDPVEGNGLVTWARTRDERIADGGAEVGMRFMREVDADGAVVKDGIVVYGSKYKIVTSAVVPPGTYDLQVSCIFGHGAQFLNTLLKVDAGKRYRFRCIGRTSRSVKLLIEQL